MSNPLIPESSNRKSTSALSKLEISSLRKIVKQHHELTAASQALSEISTDKSARHKKSYWFDRRI